MLSDTVFNSIRTSFPWIISISLIVYIAIHNDSRFSYANAVGSFDFFNATEYNENETSTQVMLSTESPCHIQRHVVFLKTYKTGSETMAGIFRRFAAMQNLSIVMSTLMGGIVYSSLNFIIEYAYHVLLMFFHENFITKSSLKHGKKVTKSIYKNPFQQLTYKTQD